MRITALFDEDGVILAAVEMDNDYAGPYPVASEETSVGTFDVPEAARGRSLVEICTSLRVDVAARRLR